MSLITLLFSLLSITAFADDTIKAKWIGDGNYLMVKCQDEKCETYEKLNSQEIASMANQTTLADSVATNIRRSLHMAGHDHVTSDVQLETLIEFEKMLIEDNPHFERGLEDEEIEIVRACHHLPTCSVFFIGSSSEYYSGYGAEGHWLMIDTQSAVAETFHAIIYNE